MRQHAVLLAGLTAVAGITAVSAARSRAHPAERVASRPSEAEVIDLDLGFFGSRIQRDPMSARDEEQLARLFLQRGRLNLAETDLREAEAHARRSLGLRRARNQAAYQVLASALMARHQFAEARDVADRLVAADSTSRSARALRGEIELELGDYTAARRTFATLQSVRTDLTVAPRYARWEELTGHPREAAELLRRAREDAASKPGMPRSQVAWFHWRLGDLAMRNGRAGEARAELERGLAIAPEDPRILATLARLSATRHRWAEAVGYGERALARALDPVTLGLLSRAYAATGDSAKSADASRAMAVATLGQPGPFHRAWSLFLLDHGADGAGVLAGARAELATRRDVYGWDLLGWALYRSGRAKEAVEAAARALGLGTHDATLYYHAGMIRLAAGDSGSGRAALRTALEIDPHWDPFQPDSARAALAR